jgi:hypothetical protein
MNAREVTCIEMLPAVTLHEVDVTPVKHLAIQQDTVALGVMSAEAQQDTLLGSGLEVTLLQLHRGVNNDLTAPHTEMVNTGPLSCE